MVSGCYTNSCGYISNLLESEEVYKDLAKAIKGKPNCGFKIECYHYEWVERNKEKKREKIVTLTKS